MYRYNTNIQIYAYKKMIRDLLETLHRHLFC